MGSQYRAVIRTSAVMGESLLASSQGSVFQHRKDVGVFTTPHVEDSLKSYSISWIMDIGFMRNRSRITHISPTFPTRSSILATAVRRLWRSLKLRIFSLKFFRDISAERKFQPHSRSRFLVMSSQANLMYPSRAWMHERRMGPLPGKMRGRFKRRRSSHRV